MPTFARRATARALLPLLVVTACAKGTPGATDSTTATAVTPAASTPGAASAQPGTPTVTRAPFGTLADGRAVESFTLRNARGIEVRAITYGGIITHLRTPDRTGRFDDIVLGYDDLAGYLKESPYFGAIVGRYANRIANGRFSLEGRSYTLARNNGPNTLHGGTKGFDKVVWAAEPFQTDSTAGVVLTYTSPDMEEGYPGTLRTRVTYTLDNRDQLAVDYAASTDKATPINLSQHSYFNLVGGARRDILDHVLTLDADRTTPVDSTLIPTGTIAPVAGTPFDFRTPTAIGARIGQDDEQLRFGKGYDHNFVLTAGSGVRHAARVLEPTSGRTLDILTDQPAIQFYSGNFLDGTIVGKGGQRYGHRFAIALETQHFPDSPNHPNFPSTILRPGQEFRSRTVFQFGVAR
jgi:aldose 1-epimerase